MCHCHPYGILCKIMLLTCIFIVRQVCQYFLSVRCAIVTLQVLTEKAKSVAGVQQWPYKAVAKALEVIPRTLIQNCGANTIRTLTALRVSTHVQLSKFIQGCHEKLLRIRFLSTSGKLLNCS